MYKAKNIQEVERSIVNGRQEVTGSYTRGYSVVIFLDRKFPNKLLFRSIANCIF